MNLLAFAPPLMQRDKPTADYLVKGDLPYFRRRQHPRRWIARDEGHGAALRFNLSGARRTRGSSLYRQRPTRQKWIHIHSLSARYFARPTFNDRFDPLRDLDDVYGGKEPSRRDERKRKVPSKISTIPRLSWFTSRLAGERSPSVFYRKYRRRDLTARKQHCHERVAQTVCWFIETGIELFALVPEDYFGRFGTVMGNISLRQAARR